MEIIMIPVPPLVIQKRLFVFLDTFTELTAELEANLQHVKSNMNITVTFFNLS